MEEKKKKKKVYVAEQNSEPQTQTLCENSHVAAYTRVDIMLAQCRATGFDYLPCVC